MTETKSLQTPTETTSLSQPWSEFDRILENLQSRFFDAFGAGFPVSRFDVFDLAPTMPAWKAAPTDVTDHGDGYKIVSEIPGIAKDKLDIRVRGTSVEIRAENSTEAKQQVKDWVHRERSYLGFYRSLELPEPVVATEAKAQLKDGVLELDIPKQHPTPSPAEVKVSVQ